MSVDSREIPREVRYDETANIQVTSPIYLKILNPPVQVFNGKKQVWGWWQMGDSQKTDGRVEAGWRIEVFSPGAIIITDA
ncbi:hypothetical protein CDD83_7723 [Cordyceps sp. RAO-2017]|nr:hypothetical protein CDD83_7723 [Cordyceps sp. RAO-2017]